MGRLGFVVGSTGLRGGLWSRLSFRFRLVCFYLPLAKIFLVLGESHRISLDLQFVCVKNTAFERRNGFEFLSAGPCFRGSSSKRSIYQADGDFQSFSELFSEIVSDGGEIGDRRGAADFPFPIGRDLRFVFRDTGHGQESQLFVGGPGNCGIGFEGILELPLHVRLAATDPDLTDENVRDSEGIFTGDFQRVRTTGRKRAKFDIPLPP